MDEYLISKAGILELLKRNLILETYILLQSAETNMNSDDTVLCGTAYSRAILYDNNVRKDSQNNIQNNKVKTDG